MTPSSPLQPPHSGRSALALLTLATLLCCPLPRLAAAASLESLLPAALAGAPPPAEPAADPFAMPDFLETSAEDPAASPASSASSETDSEAGSASALPASRHHNLRIPAHESVYSELPLPSVALIELAALSRAHAPGESLAFLAGVARPFADGSLQAVLLAAATRNFGAEVAERSKTPLLDVLETSGEMDDGGGAGATWLKEGLKALRAAAEALDSGAENAGAPTC
eukprot:CAMPEP_0174900876 /NCGR_PEP_ID=MMETSP0167-20121228/32879_1 /TAXON_ID=38298 /ORGANISM="Rhodella maculata, Strain CCMP736" /LENGTH=225 /DNA_ID=CAMNT_0016142439 /DNA_START=11 /DNA_END=685 /DNA_ORIENTATION=+